MSPVLLTVHVHKKADPIFEMVGLEEMCGMFQES